MKEEILAKEEELRQAMIKADISRLEKLIHDKLIFHIPGGMIVSKEMDLENYRSRKMRVYKLIILTQKVEVYGDAAVVSVEVEMEGNFDAHDFEGRFRFLRVWKQEEGNWKVVAGASSPLSS